VKFISTSVQTQVERRCKFFPRGRLQYHPNCSMGNRALAAAEVRRQGKTRACVILYQISLTDGYIMTCSAIVGVMHVRDWEFASSAPRHRVS